MYKIIIDDLIFKVKKNSFIIEFKYSYIVYIFNCLIKYFKSSSMCCYFCVYFNLNNKDFKLLF